MPACCVRNCRSRSGRSIRENKNVLLYYFPKERELRRQWLEACQRKEGDIKLSCAAVCERHFVPDCIEEKWTQQRSKNQPRVIRRLKKGSIPTELLNIPKEIIPQLGKSKEKIPRKSRIPSYNELVACAKRNTEMYANAVSTENILKNDKQDEQSKSGHGDLPVELAEAMDIFPRNPKLRKLWIEALRVKNAQQSALKLSKTAQICVLHLDDSCIKQFGLSHVRLKPDSVPMKFSHDEPKERDLLHSRHDIAIVPSPFVKLNNVPKAVFPTFWNKNLPVPKIIDSVNEVRLYYEVKMKVPINNMKVAEEVVHPDINHLNIGIGKHVVSHSHEKWSSDQEEHNYSPEIAGCDVEEPMVYQKSETPKRKIQYPGDVAQEHLESMTPRSISKAFTVLRQSCQRKSVHIKRLQRQLQRQKKKMESLKKLLSQITKQNLLYITGKVGS